MALQFPVSSILSSFIFLILLCLTDAICFKTICQGEPCTVDGLPGNGTYLRKCKSVLDDYRNGRPICVIGYYFFEPIVCCPLPYITTTATTIATTPQPSDTTSITPTESPITTTTVEPRDSKTIVKEECDKHHPGGFKIYHGASVNETEFPHMAAMFIDRVNKTNFICGGTLISERYVVTAAHCTHEYNITQIYIVLGALDIHSMENNMNMSYQIINKTEHPRWTTKQGSPYDIAVLKLKTNVTFSESVYPACLPSSFQNYSKAYITGWGGTGNASISPVLLKSEVALLSIDDCKKEISNLCINKTLCETERKLCAGNNSTDTCQGDSGGPLSVWDDNKYFLIGLTSYGRRGCQPGFGIYTDVFSYIEWIQGIVWPNSD